MKRDSSSSISEQSANSEIPCPNVLKLWNSLYESFPKLFHIPSTNLDMTFTIMSFFVLLQVKFFIKNVLLPSYFEDHEFEGPEEISYYRDVESISVYLTSIVHSSTLCVVLFFLLFRSNQKFHPSANMSSHPEWWQTSTHAILQFCIGYMLYDGLYNSFYRKKYVENNFTVDDICFLGHHLATSYYMSSVRMNGAGHMSAMIIMFFGEVTNPAQNTRSSLKVLLTLGPTVQGYFSFETIQNVLFPLVDFVYALMYSLVRVILNPYLNILITYDFLFTKGGRGRMSLPLSLSLLFMLWGVTIGTVPWMIEAVQIVLGYFSNFGLISRNSISTNEL